MEKIDNYLGIYSKDKPQKTFLDSSNKKYSYKEFDDLVENFSKLLSNTKKNPAVILCENKVNYCLALLSIYRSDNIAIPINPEVSDDFLKKVIKQTNCQIVILDPIFDQRIKDIGLKSKKIIMKSVSNHKVINMKINRTKKEIYEDVRLILHTSGTTGIPKAVLLTDSNIISNAKSIVKVLKINENDLGTLSIPPYHAYGNSIITSHLLAGSTIKIIDSKFPQTMFNQIKGATIFYGVPSNYTMLLKFGKMFKDIFKDINLITCAGGKLPLEHIRMIKKLCHSINICLMYGQTEATARLTYVPVENFEKGKNSIGKPIPGVKLKIVDSNLEEVKINQEGQIIAKGPNIMKGYLNESDTKKKIHLGWLLTGDYGIKRKNGFFELVGRNTDFVKNHGHRINLLYIEQKILGFRGVSEVIVYIAEDSSLLVADIVVTSNKKDLVTKLNKYCKKHLANYEIPKFNVVKSIKKTLTGKIIRRKQETKNFVLCKKCILNEKFPRIEIDRKTGLCSLCKRKNNISVSHINEKKKHLREVILKNKSEKIDVLLALSGGKDSCYTMLKLFEEFPKIKMVGVLVDNGHISKQAIKNAELICKFTHSKFKRINIGGKSLDELFLKVSNLDIYPQKVIERASSICATCSGFFKQIMFSMSIKERIPLVAFGWTPGQSFRPVIETNKSFLEWTRKSFAKYLENQKIPLKAKKMVFGKRNYSNKLPIIIHPLCLFKYNEKKMISELKIKVGWEKPKNVDQNTSNCRLNKFATLVHIKKYGIHPYALEVAYLVREGLLSRKEGIKRIYGDIESSKEININLDGERIK